MSVHGSAQPALPLFRLLVGFGLPELGLYKRCFFPGRKAMTNLGSILKSRAITPLTKVRRIEAIVFPVVMYRYESWTIKKAERQRTDAFKLWCWRRPLRVP